MKPETLFGGSWVVIISGVISKVAMGISPY